MGTLHFLQKAEQGENNRLKHRGVILAKFLRRRGHIWRIKSDNDNDKIETSSALTPTGAVTINKNKRFKPFPGTHTRYTQRSFDRQHRQQPQESTFNETEDDHEEKTEYRKPQIEQDSKPNRRVVRILPEKKTFNSVVHATTPVDQLQMIRMMANIMYKSEYKRRRTKQQGSDLIQGSNTDRAQNTEINSLGVGTNFKSRQQYYDKRKGVKDIIPELVDRINRINQFRDRKKNKSHDKNNFNEQSTSGIRKANLIDTAHERIQQNSNAKNNEFSKDDYETYDEVTPPTSFSNIQKEQKHKHPSEAAVEEKAEDEFNILFRNVASRIEFNTKAQTRHTESSPTTEHQPETTVTTTSASTTTATTTTTTTATAATTTVTRTTTSPSTASTTEYTTISTTPHEITQPTPVTFNRGIRLPENNKTKLTMHRNNFNERYGFRHRGNNGRKENNSGNRNDQVGTDFIPSHTRSTITKSYGPSGQSVRRHLNQPDQNLYRNDGTHGNNHTMGTREITLSTPVSTKGRPVIRWDGRHSTVGDWLKTLRPTYPPPIKILPSMAVISNEISTMVDDNYWQNHDITQKIYHPNSNDVTYRNRVKFSQKTTKITSLHPEAERTTLNNIQTNYSNVTPYDILMEEEKIATQFTDISISLGKKH